VKISYSYNPNIELLCILLDSRSIYIELVMMMGFYNLFTI